jgi:hypothetical protein
MKVEWLSICAPGHSRLAGVRLPGASRVGHPYASIEPHPRVGMAWGNSSRIPAAGNVFPVPRTNQKPLEAISKSGFSFEIKAKPRINPQAYFSMART